MSRPQYRVALCRTTLARVRANPRREQILSRLDPTVIETIDDGRGLAWIDASMVAALNIAIREVLGPEAFYAFYVDHVDAMAESKLIQSLLAGARRLFANNPAGYVRWLARAWDGTTRNMGKVEFVESEGRLQITYAGLPPELCEPHMRDVIVASLDGISAKLAERPVITVDTSRFHAGDLVVTLEW